MITRLEDSYFNLVTPPVRNLRITNLFNQVINLQSIKTMVHFKFDKRLCNSEKFITEFVQELKNL